MTVTSGGGWVGGCRWAPAQVKEAWTAPPGEKVDQKTTCSMSMPTVSLPIHYCQMYFILLWKETRATSKLLNAQGQCQILWVSCRRKYIFTSSRKTKPFLGGGVVVVVGRNLRSDSRSIFDLQRRRFSSFQPPELRGDQLTGAQGSPYSGDVMAGDWAQGR